VSITTINESQIQSLIFKCLLVHTSLNLEEFDKPCLLFFTRWNKTFESEKLVQKTHNMANEHVVSDNVCYESSWVKYPFFQQLKCGFHLNIIIC
jgi:hypothetical protein